MVKFIFGGAGSGKTEYVYREIERLLKETDKKICLIVPEPYTVATEAALARRFPATAALRLEGTNFTRLADSLARLVGGLSYTHLTSGAKMLLLWRALMSVWPTLSELNRVSDGDGTGLIPTLFAAERELKVGGVTPEALSAAADELSDGESSTLSGRLRDLATVCAASAALAEEEYDGIEDPIRRLAESAHGSTYFKNTCVFIDSFYSITGAQSKVITEIIRSADDVYITVPMDSRDAEGIHLDGVKDYYKAALGAALRYGGAPEFVTLSGNKRATTAELEAVSSRLWDVAGDAPAAESSLPSVPDSVAVYSVKDRYAEAEALCSVICKLVRGGAKYSDIAVACADVAPIRGICDSALRRHGIPAFIAEESRLTSSPAVRLILSLLRIPGRWRREDVISIVKTGLSPLNDTLACAFESYTATWNIRGSRSFTSPWSMNPDGYKEELTDRGKALLMQANEARDALIPPLESFASTFEGGGATVRDVCISIVEYFEATGAYERLMSRADAIEAAGASDDAARERLTWREICTAFDTMTDIVGDVRVDASGFTALFRYAVSDLGTGAIPTGVDVVTVAGAETLRTDGIKHMIILGAIDGEFPRVPEDRGYFSDDDRRRLAEAGIILGGDTSRRASEELFRFYRAAAQASHSLTVFTPKSSAGSPARPSEGAMRIMSIKGREDIPAFEGEIFDKLSMDSTCRARNDLGLDALRRELYGEPESPLRVDSELAAVSTATANEIFGNHLHLSQSRIDSYVKCPMSYYCKYVLGLSEDRRAEISAPDIGSFVHAILDELLKRITGTDSYPEGAELYALCDEIIKGYLRRTCGEVTDGRMSYLFIRLRRQVLLFAEAVIREASQSRFTTYRTELPMGIGSGEDSPPAIIFPLEDGGEVSLHGFIDRMDVYKRDGVTYIRVIDYKTGKKHFSYDDVKLGLNVQLLIYLFSAWKAENSSFHRALDGGDGTLEPAGALYFNLRPADVTSDCPLTEEEAREIILDSMERSGVVTDDRDVLDAMDRGITGKYVPVSLRSDGSYKKSASLATLERFGELYRELEGVICRIASEMKRGGAAAKPLEKEKACEYCKMRSVCRRSTES